MSTIEKTVSNLSKCICHRCPTYTFTCKVKAVPGIVKSVITDLSKAEHIDSMFCVFGPSTCIDEEKTCICSECELFKEHGLDKIYYCTKDGGK